MIYRDSISISITRRAFTLLEVCVASVMVGVLLTTTLQVLGWVAAENRANDYRRVALCEAENALDRVTAQPWDTIVSGLSVDRRAEQRLRSQLPGAQTRLLVTPFVGPPTTKRVEIEIAWQPRATIADRVTLTTWVFLSSEEKP